MWYDSTRHMFLSQSISNHRVPCLKPTHLQFLFGQAWKKIKFSQNLA